MIKLTNYSLIKQFLTTTTTNRKNQCQFNDEFILCILISILSNGCENSHFFDMAQVDSTLNEEVAIQSPCRAK